MASPSKGHFVHLYLYTGLKGWRKSYRVIANPCPALLAPAVITPCCPGGLPQRIHLGTGTELLLVFECLRYFPAGGRRINQEVGTNAYSAVIERMMQRLFGSLGESARRRYAAIEAAKLGHGGVEYVAGVLGCDPKTIRQG